MGSGVFEFLYYIVSSMCMNMISKSPIIPSKNQAGDARIVVELKNTQVFPQSLIQNVI